MSESTPSDLTKFQLDLLTILVAKPRAGARVLEEVESQYGDDVPHGRVYQNISKLVEQGLVTKHEEELDGRTNLYAANSEGVAVAREYAGTLWRRVSRVPDEYVSGGSPYNPHS